MLGHAPSLRNDERGARSSPAVELNLGPVRMALKGIRHGEVRVIIQDGVIVQIDRVERQRLR